MLFPSCYFEIGSDCLDYKINQDHALRWAKNWHNYFLTDMKMILYEMKETKMWTIYETAKKTLFLTIIKNRWRINIDTNKTRSKKHSPNYLMLIRNRTHLLTFMGIMFSFIALIFAWMDITGGVLVVVVVVIVIVNISHPLALSLCLLNRLVLLLPMLLFGASMSFVFLFTI